MPTFRYLIRLDAAYVTMHTVIACRMSAEEETDVVEERRLYADTEQKMVGAISQSVPDSSPWSAIVRLQ